MRKVTCFVLVIVVITTGCAHKITGNTNSSTSVSKNPENVGTGMIDIKAGQKYSVENKVTTNSNSEMQGQSMETKANVTAVYNIEVNNLQDNNYSMTNKIASVKLNMTMMGQDVNFDSDKKEDMDGEMGSSFKSLVHQPIPVVMDKSGNIIAGKTDSMEKAPATQAEIMLKQLGDPKENGYGAKMAFTAIPKNAKAGSTWKDSTSSDGITKITNYTIKEINADTANITISGTEIRDEKMQIQGMDVSTKTTGKFDGTQAVDIHTGVIYTNMLDANSSGSISVMGQDIPTKIKVTSVTTVKPM